MKKAPESLELVLLYANADATEKTWRGIVAAPHADFVGGPGRSVEATPMGVPSLESFENVQSRLREFLKRLIDLEGAYSLDARALATELLKRAEPRFERWAFSTTDEHLFEVWDTKDQSFEQSIYFSLAIALKEISFRDLNACEECKTFFFKASDRERKYCSNKCRSRVMARQHRQRKADKQPTGRKAKKAPAGKTSRKKSDRKSQ